MAVDRQDNIYISDNDDNAVHERIIKLTPMGKELSEWHFFPPDRIGSVQGPGSIAFDAQGNMYIIDLGQDKVLKVSPAGKILTSWGSNGSGAGQFEQPEAIAVDARSNVYIGDNDNGSGRVEKFSDTGKYLGIVMMLVKPDPSTQFSQYNPIGLAVDSNNNLYVANDISLTKLSPTGQVIGKTKITDYTSTLVS